MQRPLCDDIAVLFLVQLFIIALCAVNLSGILNAYSTVGIKLIIIPIFSKSVFAYRNVTPFGVALIELHPIVAAIDAF